MNFSYRTTDAIIQSIIQFAHVSRLFFSVLAVNPSSDKIWHRVVQKKKWHKDTQNSIFFFFFFCIRASHFAFDERKKNRIVGNLA